MAKKKRKRTRKPGTGRPGQGTNAKNDNQKAKNGRRRCEHVIPASYGHEARQCKMWQRGGSKFCARHGAAAAQAGMEKSIDEGKHLRDKPPATPVGLRRVLDGRFADLWDCVFVELADDDLSQELASLRAALSTILQETAARYEEWKAQAVDLAVTERVEYWQAYNSMLSRIRTTVDSIRKVVQTIADVKAKQEGNTLTMVQVVALVGELITAMTEIIGDDTDKLESLRAALDRLDWLPS